LFINPYRLGRELKKEFEMVATTEIQKVETGLAMYGDRDDIDALARRIKVMVPGGDKLNTNEALALAQISQACKLNPFIGEVWYIPGKGGMVGIRGARRYANEQVKDEAGRDAYWFPDIQPCPPAEAGATESEKVVAAFRCVIHDSASTFQYQKALTALISELRAAGYPDPYGEAVKIVGPKPQWIGYGYSTTTDQTRMNKMQVARKRAEADALKKRFYIPFGATVSEFEDKGEDDVIDVDRAFPPDEPVRRTPYPREQAIADLTGIPVAKQETHKTIAERPYTAEQLKARIFEIATEHQKKGKLSATAAQRGLVAGVLTECFAGDPDAEKIRHSVTKFLTGSNSVSANDGAPGMYVQALLDWLQPTKDTGGAYHADPVAVKEAHAVWTAANIDVGQMTLGGVA
jgi:hypothetical protein